MNLFSMSGGEGNKTPWTNPKNRIPNDDEYIPPAPKSVDEDNLGLEAAKRNLPNVTSWEEIHEHDMEYFKEELREIYGLESEQDVREEAIRRAKDGFSFSLDIIAKFYGLPSGSSFEEILKKKNSQK